MPRMKLADEFPEVKSAFSKNLAKIKEYAPRLKKSREYINFDERLTWECLRAFIGTNTICEWYRKYNCGDSHIYTLGRTALKELGVL